VTQFLANLEQCSEFSIDMVDKVFFHSCEL